MTTNNSNLVEYAVLLIAFNNGKTVVIHTVNGTILLNKKYQDADTLKYYYAQAYETRVIEL